MPSLDPSSSGTRRDERSQRHAAAAVAPHTRAERVAITFPRDTHYLAIVRKVVADAALRAGFDADDVAKIELAVDEACSNAIVYQVDHEGAARFNELGVEIKLERPRFTVVLQDRGAPYPFDEQGNFDLEDQLRRLEPGGLGIYIIKNFMDEVSYNHSPRDGNTLTMVKFLAR
jgi:anti-sigma regulatory factor (Ser/Thr protein kinase)